MLGSLELHRYRVSSPSTLPYPNPQLSVPPPEWTAICPDSRTTRVDVPPISSRRRERRWILVRRRPDEFCCLTCGTSILISLYFGDTFAEEGDISFRVDVAAVVRDLGPQGMMVSFRPVLSKQHELYNGRYCKYVGYN